MGGTPVIVWVREGVGFAAPAAASFRRAEASWGSQIDCNSSYRDYGVQLAMWQAWTAWAEGWGPKPPHSRALHPDKSVHCLGYALDSDDWTKPGFIAHMADHGWVRTAASDPTERHHFEYLWWRDNHRNDPEPPRRALMALSDKQQDELYAWVKDIQNRVRGPKSDIDMLQDILSAAAETRVRVRGGRAEVDMLQDILGRVGGTVVEFDEAAVAAELAPALAPYLAQNLGGLSDDTVAAIAKAAADEADRRELMRLETGATK